MSGEKESVRRKGRRNAYQDTYDEIARMIDSEELLPGDQLPTYPQLTVRYGISHATATKVIRMLKEHGYVESSTKGTFVLRSRREALLQQLADILNALEKDGQDPVFETDRNGACIVGRVGAVCWRPSTASWAAEIF